MDVEILKKIVRIPKDFYEDSRGKSFYQLIADSGFNECSHHNMEAEIGQYLKDNLVYVAYWLRWSEDKRTETGWFMRTKSINLIEVGFLNKSVIQERFEFADICEACAFFINKEIKKTG